MVPKTYFQNLSLLILKRNTLNQLKNRVSPEINHSVVWQTSFIEKFFKLQPMSVTYITKTLSSNKSSHFYCERLGTLRSNDADDNEDVKKTIGLISKTTTSHVHHTFLYISFPFLHDYDVKMPNFAFYGGRKQPTTKFYFSF